MRSLRLWLLFVIAAAMVGCGAPRIDARSDETLRDSMLRVRASLSRERQAKFDEAIFAMTMDVGFATLGISSKAPTPDAVRQVVKSALDGKTAEEVLAEGERLAKSRRP
jgi:hypothetical protein